MLIANCRMRAHGQYGCTQDFCQFGGAHGETELDGAKFAKLCKECGVLSKSCTRTDVDLEFARVKTHGQRKINFDQFQTALESLAAKKYGRGVDKAEAFDRLKSTILKSGGPEVHGTEAVSGGIVGKLTDTSLYTGAHRERFDADGHGRGAAGRDVGGKGAGSTAGRSTGGVSDLSQITRPNLG